jgi:ADP-ribosylglycohydrolase
MITRKELLTNPELLADKVRGALCGLAIGDSLGDACRMPENQRDYGFTTDFNKGASWSTDDTEFAIFTAKMLIDHKGNPSHEDLAKGWLTYIAAQDDFPRGGNSEIEAAENLKKGIMPPESGRRSVYGFSDGACMRIAPVGIVCAGDVERAKELAKRDAEVSHNFSGIWAAQAVAAAVATAMVSGTDEEIIEAAMSCIPTDCWLYDNMKHMLELVELAETDFCTAWMALHDDFRTRYKASVEEAIPQAFALFLLSKGDFRRGIILAANFGRDADTIGAVLGALRGAQLGASAIDPSWIERTGYPSGTCLQFTKGLTIRGLAEDLAALIK